MQSQWRWWRWKWWWRSLWWDPQCQKHAGWLQRCTPKHTPENELCDASNGRGKHKYITQETEIELIWKMEDRKLVQVRLGTIAGTSTHTLPHTATPPHHHTQTHTHHMCTHTYTICPKHQLGKETATKVQQLIITHRKDSCCKRPSELHQSVHICGAGSTIQDNPVHTLTDGVQHCSGGCKQVSQQES